jgi:hypothetical protein
MLRDIAKFAGCGGGDGIQRTQVDTRRFYFDPSRSDKGLTLPA